MAVHALIRRLLTVGFANRVLLAFLVVALFLVGVQLRRWTGEKTRHVRSQRDIDKQLSGIRAQIPNRLC